MVMITSDATGETVERMVRAATLQFSEPNVPVVLGVDPPEELSQVDDRKVFGVIVQSDMLMRIRQARLSHLGVPSDSSYGQRAHIENEIAYSHEIFRKHANQPVIHVTNRAIEETAADILRTYQVRNTQP